MGRTSISNAIAVAIGLAALFAYDVFMGPARIIVINETAVPLRDVVVSGNGFRFGVDVLPPGKTSCHNIRGFGESSLRLVADLGGKSVDVRDLGYLEGSGGYRVRLRVAETGAVEFESEFGLVPRFCGRAAA